MNRFYSILLSFSSMLFLIAGCSGGGLNAVNPDVYTDNAVLPDISEVEGTPSFIWGQWTFDFDLENMKATVTPERVSEHHYNITGRLPAPTIKVNSFDPTTKIIDADVTIRNPYGFAGYDIRGIVYTDNIGHMLTNADNWTNLFDIPGGKDVNPFRAFAKDVPNRQFAAYGQHTEKFMIYLPPDPSPVHYAVEASLPLNCEEPYLINNFIQTPIFENIGSSCDIGIDVFDWQDNVSDVALDAQLLTGEPVTHMVYQGGNTWGATIYNQTGLPVGTYEFPVSAVASDSGSLALYDFVNITVTKSITKTEWVFLVYLHESNLYDYAIQDINEMEVAGSRDGDLDIIVLWDKEENPDDVILRIEKDPGGFNYDIISPEVDDGGAVIPPGGLVMGDEQTLEKFLRWAMTEYPAQHYALDLWDHGDGPFGITPQETGFIRSCCNGLSIWEIRDACTAVLAEHPEIGKLDFIGFDACLMAWIETAYCLRNVSKSTLGSEMTEPGDGWFYTTPLQYILDNIATCDYKALCQQIVTAYLDGTSIWDDCTLSASDNEMLVNNVVPILNEFAVELKNELGSNYSTIYNCWEQCGDWGAYCWEYDVKDLGYFCQLIEGKSNLPSSLRNKATNLRNAIAAAMIARGHTGSGLDACPWKETGWQIWFTDIWFDSWNESRRADYGRLEFTQTSWDEFLQAFY